MTLASLLVTTEEGLIAALVDKGGVVLLAGILILLGYRSQTVVVKVLERVLDQSAATEKSNVALTEVLRSVKEELAAVRAHIHTLVNGMAATELRLRALEAGVLDDRRRP